ncbi:MAG TPA: peptidoglycan-binding domain-containing protein [Candidatus Paceibacterota bacterium]
MQKFRKIAVTAIFACALAFAGSSPAPAAAATCVDLQANIRVGDKGANVASLQTFLSEQGFLKAKVDGSYGPQTKAAVLAFQATRNLVSDPAGFIGAGSRAQIKAISCGGTVTPVNPGTTAPTQPGTSYLQPNIAVCQPGMLFNTATGQPCVSSSSVTPYTNIPGCTATSLFSIVTGQRCDGTQSQTPSQTVLPAGCFPGSLFSIVTGLPCSSNNSQTPFIPDTGTPYNQKPDLRITDVVCTPSSIRVGDRVNCDVSIENNSSVNIDSSFNVEVLGVIKTVPSPLYAWMKQTVSIPGAFSLGTTGFTTVNFRIDSSGTVDEINESNNTYNKSFYANAAVIPDLSLNHASPTCPYTFGADLSVGSSGNDVIALQNILKSLLYYSGNSHGYFNDAVKAAVSAFQSAKGITPADGNVGAVTRASLGASCTGTGGSLSLTLAANVSATTGYQLAPITVSWTGTNVISSSVMTVELIKASDSSAVAGVKTTAKYSAGSIAVTLPATLPAGQYRFAVSTPVSGGSLRAVTPVFAVPEAGAVISANGAHAIVAEGPSTKNTGLVATFNLTVKAQGVNIGLLAAADIGVVFIGPNGEVINDDSVAVVTNPSRTISSGQSAQVTITSKVAASKISASGAWKADLRSVRWGTSAQTAQYVGIHTTPTVTFTK